MFEKLDGAELAAFETLEMAWAQLDRAELNARAAEIEIEWFDAAVHAEPDSPVLRGFGSRDVAVHDAVYWIAKTAAVERRADAVVSISSTSRFIDELNELVALLSHG